jgi:glutathione S-transferase
MMKLIGSLTSPYVRKVRIVAAEKRVDYDWMQEDPWQPDSTLSKLNPLGKVPALLLEDGSVLFDSRVICEFLDGVSPIAKLLPQGNRERIEVKRWEALCDGILDAAILTRLENNRPANERSDAWIERQWTKVERGLDAIEMQLQQSGTNWSCGTVFTLADISLAACIGWLDYRFPERDCHADRPCLDRMAIKLAERPSVMETAPPQ